MERFDDDVDVTIHIVVELIFDKLNKREKTIEKKLFLIATNHHKRLFKY
jgi:hypothetical protein